MLRGGLEWWHIVIIAVVLFGLFGYKRLPSATKSVAQSLKIFRDETKGLRGDDHDHHDHHDHHGGAASPGEHVGGTSTSGAIPAPSTIPAPATAQQPPAAQPVQITTPAAVPTPVPVAAPVAPAAQSLAPKPTSR